MITAIVQFDLLKPITREEGQKTFLETAPKYCETRGLIRKYYLLSKGGGTVGGVYLWESMADAERLYTPEWRNFIREKYGAEPRVDYFETPVIVDNTVGIVSADE